MTRFACDSARLHDHADGTLGAEGRAALARDPGNAMIAELLVVTYRQKVDVLRRATELPAGS